MNYKDVVAWQGLLAQLPRIVPFLLLLGMLVTLSWSCWQFWQLQQAGTVTPVSSEQTLTKTQFTEQDYAILLSEARLFGTYTKEQKLPVRVTTIAAPVTSLNLELTAVFFQGNTDSVAMIAKGRSPAKMYGLNDSVEPGIVVKAIEPEAVTIQREGRLEKVVFKRFSGKDGQVDSIRSPRPSSSYRSSQREPPVPAFLKNKELSGKRSG